MPQHGTMIDTNHYTAATFLSGGWGKVVVAPFPDFFSSAMVIPLKLSRKAAKNAKKKDKDLSLRFCDFARDSSSFFGKDPVHNVPVRLGLILILGPGVLGDQIDQEQVFLLMAHG